MTGTMCLHCLRGTTARLASTRGIASQSRRVLTGCRDIARRSYATQTEEGIYILPQHLDRRRPASYRRTRQLSIDDIWSTEANTVAADAAAAAEGVGSDAALALQLLHAIQARSSSRVFQALQDVHRSGKYRLLDSPEKLVACLETLAPQRRTVGGGHPESVSLSDYRKRMEFFRDFLADGVHANALKPDREVFFLLLEHARVCGDDGLARATWAQMLDAGIEPDVFCYNTLLATTCAQPSDFDKTDLLRRRRMPENRVKSRQAGLEAASNKSRQALQIYRDILAQGLEPTSMTIELLILAMAANANLDAVKVLLRQTWGVEMPPLDFESQAEEGVVDEFDEEGIYDSSLESSDGVVPEPKVAKTSPLYPTPMTCRVLAIALGANNQSRCAAKLIKSLCDQYKLQPSAAAWTEVLKWAHLDAGIGSRGGYAPADVVQKLFTYATTTATPAGGLGAGAGVTPSIGMHSYLIKSYIAREHHVRAGEAIVAMIDSAEADLERIVTAADKDKKRRGSKAPSEVVVDIDEDDHDDDGISYVSDATTKIANLVARTVVVTESTLHSVTTQMARRIRQCEARLGRAKVGGGSDEIRIASEQLQQRLDTLDRLQGQVEDKLLTFEEKARALRPTAVAPHSNGLDRLRAEFEHDEGEDRSVAAAR